MALLPNLQKKLEVVWQLGKLLNIACCKARLSFLFDKYDNFVFNNYDQTWWDVFYYSFK